VQQQDQTDGKHTEMNKPKSTNLINTTSDRNMKGIQMPAQKAFTLIELLIVVAIIAILAAIAVPNFLEAQVRAKVSRAKADMRSVKTGLESYFVDNNRYMTDINGAPTDARFTTADDEFVGWIQLTTPISYLSSVFTTPFQSKDPAFDNNPNGDQNVYEYWGPGFLDTFSPQIAETTQSSGIGYVVGTLGPDLDRDFIGTSFIEFVRLNNRSGDFIYDPSNGTISSGDVLSSNKVGFYGQQ